MMRRLSRRWVLAVAYSVAVMLLACANPPSPAPRPAAQGPDSALPASGAAPATPALQATPTRPPVATVLVHTPTESTSSLPLTLAKRLGYYMEEGIDLDLRQMLTNVGIAALFAGEVQYTTGTTSAMSAAAKGAPVRVVVSLADQPSHVLVGARGLTSPEALRGGTIATSSPGAVPYREAQVAVRHFGIDPQAVTLVTLPNDAVRQAALESGAAQAAVLNMPYNFMLERDGYPRLLNFAEGDLLRLPVSGLSGVLDYLTTSEDEVVRTLRATLRGLRAIRDDRGAATAALQDFFSIDAATAEALYDAVIASYTLDGRFSASAIRGAIESADEAVRGVDPNTLIDYRYLDRASQSLGAW